MSVIVSAVLSIPLAALGGVLIGPIVQTATRRRAREIRATAPRRTAR
jgi:branched-subunit amino acid ABC-type transport system permease component